MFPLILLGLGLTTVGGYALKHMVSSVGAGPGPTVSGKRMSGTYLKRLSHCLRNGIEPPDRLLECAMYEAVKHGREDIADAIWERFFVENDGQSSGDGEEIKTDETGTDHDTVTVSGKSSPIEGIDNDSWNQFVNKLATNEPTFATKKHVGKYHQNRDRLAELGFTFEGIPDEETQYAALSADVADAHSRSSKLIADYLATVVMVNGQECPVTLSGILGLCKSAGIGNAESWLANETDRSQFPNTTAVFLSTNGVF
jgi:hypothetical protein